MPNKLARFLYAKKVKFKKQYLVEEEICGCCLINVFKK